MPLTNSKGCQLPALSTNRTIVSACVTFFPFFQSGSRLADVAVLLGIGAAWTKRALVSPLGQGEGLDTTIVNAGAWNDDFTKREMSRPAYFPCATLLPSRNR